ncbi:FAD-dependent oxidoreductase, partial [Mycobacterium tuberculosis]|nr:FAD-dependent oxidoreductase [Mycobacterium tuberculosis]
GMLRYAFPEYRLPKAVLNKEIELIRRLGVQFQLGATLGKTVTLDELDARYNAVFMALGTWKDVDIGLPGAEFRGVLSSLAFLEAHALGRAPEIGRKVVVVGGGNSAIDAARSSLRMGAEATVVYRRERRYM